MTLETKTDKWAVIVMRLLLAYRAPISCRELSHASGLDIYQVEQALKSLRFEGKVDYFVMMYTQRMWHLTVEEKVFD
jgi:chromosome segregation and condensation protein ScpB